MKSISVKRQTIFLGNCLKGMQQELRPKSVDVICTSPPYNLGINYASYIDKLDAVDYLSFVEHVARAMKLVLKDNGSIFLNVGGSNKNPWIPFAVANVFREFFVLQNSIVWVKSIAVDSKTSGQFKPINSKRFTNLCHEHIFHFTKNGDVELDKLAAGVPFTSRANVARFKHASNKRCRGSTWFVPYETVVSREEKFNHPASFPIALPKLCIKLHGKRNAVVLDPFLGTGTTLVAAAKLNCRGIGFEIDSRYCTTAVKRLRGEQP